MIGAGVLLTGQAFLPRIASANVIKESSAAANNASLAKSYLSVALYPEFRTARDAQISPDGSAILFVVRSMDKMRDVLRSSIWHADLKSGATKKIVDGGSSPRWSPDGGEFAYRARDANDRIQLFIMRSNDPDRTRQLTNLTRSPSYLSWSPDGSRLVFRQKVGHAPEWPIQMPTPPEGATWRETPKIIDRLHYRLDRSGYVHDGWDHFFEVNPADGTIRQLTGGEWNVVARLTGLVDDKGSIAWAPDGRTFYFDGNDSPNADLQAFTSDVFALDMSTGARRRLTPGKGFWLRPAASPDGEWVAYAGYAHGKYYNNPIGLWLCRRDGTDHRALWRDTENEVRDLRWAQDGSGVFFTMKRQGGQHLGFCSFSGEERYFIEDAHTLSLDSVSSAGVAAGIHSTAHQPTDVVTYPLARPREIKKQTRINKHILKDVKLGKVEEIRYRSAKGASVHAVLVHRATENQTAPGAFILRIRGGPQSMTSAAFNYEMQNYAANGYTVLNVNYRGSVGFGYDFTRGIEDGFPNDLVVADLMNGVDHVLDRGLADENRLFVTGSSAGGELTAWLIGQTNRFAAAASLRPHVNRMSAVGSTDLILWINNALRPPYWKDPDHWLKHSAIMNLHRAKTPTLVMTGEDDYRTPISQSEELYTALKLHGVPTRFVRIPDIAHGPDHHHTSVFMRYQLYVMDWFRQWDKAAGGADNLPPPL